MDTQSGTQLFDFATDFENALASALFYTQCSNATGSTEIQVNGSDGTTIASQVIATSTLVGTDTDTELAGGTAAVISWKGSWHYRGGKPRTYLPGLTVSALVDASTISGSWGTSLQTAAVNLITEVAAMSGSYGSSVSLGVLLGNNATSAGTFAPFTGAGINPSPCSQRRRNRSTV